MQIRQPFLQDGFSLIELIAALAIAGLAIFSTLQVFTSLNISRYQALKSTADLEIPLAGFDRFMAVYNAAEANTIAIEADTENEIAVIYNANSLDLSAQELSLPVTLDNSQDSTLQFYYRAFGNTSCSFNGASFLVTNCDDATAAAIIAELGKESFYITLDNGLLCKVVELEAVGINYKWILEDRCSEVIGNSFYPPRLVFYTKDGFSRSVMESLSSPRTADE